MDIKMYKSVTPAKASKGAQKAFHFPRSLQANVYFRMRKIVMNLNLLTFDLFNVTFISVFLCIIKTTKKAWEFGVFVSCPYLFFLVEQNNL